MFKFVNLSAEMTAYFQKMWDDDGFNVVGYLEEEGAVSGRVVLKPKPGHRAWTPTGCARDCGDHYIVARYCSYDRVEKRTMAVTEDVEDR